MAARISDDDEPIAEINVIPLVDVILVVLIIFMVTAPLVLRPSIEINLPRAASGEEMKSTTQPLNITLTPQGALYLNGELTNLQQLGPQIESIVLSQPDTAAVFYADKTVTLDKFTEVVDVVRKSGIKKVAFSIDQK
jgi:biopolymer transport protein ExbD